MPIESPGAGKNGVVTGPGGADLATDANADRSADAAENIAAGIPDALGPGGGLPIEGVDGGLPVRTDTVARNFRGLTPFASGVITIVNQACSAVELYAVYTGVAETGVFLQIHDAASTGAITTATLKRSYSVKGSQPIVMIDCPWKWDFAAGLSMAFSSSATAFTVVAGATGSAAATTSV